MTDEDESVDQGEMADEWAAAMEEQDSSSGQEGVDALLGQTSGDTVQPAEMEELQSSAKPVEGAPDLDVIMDIPVSISMEVGNTEISIRNLLQLNQGSVIELDRLAGEPLDVLVNGTLIAHGEVVVVNEKK